jgi:phosphoribosyl-ATP pyrophosphohydrolase
MICSKGSGFMAGFTLNTLEKIVAERAAVTDGSSYTATLISCGIEKCAQKMGEEAVEAAIAAAIRDRGELTKEAADLLYHLLVVLNASKIPLRDVMRELDRRTVQSGIAEKASRNPETIKKPVSDNKSRKAVAK